MQDVDRNQNAVRVYKQPIIADAIYERDEAIAVTEFSLSTLIRAEKCGDLRGRYKGRRRYYLGSDLLRWLRGELK